MTRLMIVAEGETEMAFVKNVLGEHLSSKGVYPYTMLPGKRGGNITVDRLAKEMAKLVWKYNFVSSLVDFYGFKDKGNDSVEALEQRIGEAARAASNHPESKTNIIPYVQRYEFEGLLFSRVDAFSDAALASERDVRQLHEIRSLFQTPEDINDGYDTAPNKRIKRIIRKYHKVANGLLIAQSAGLDTIRAECPRFSAWLARLESLGNP